MALCIDKIVELWAAQFPEALDFFGEYVTKGLIGPEKTAKFWSLIEKECEENPELVFGLFQMLRKARNWDDGTLCWKLGISVDTLNDVKKKKRPTEEAVGLKVLYELFPEMMV